MSPRLLVIRLSLAAAGLALLTLAACGGPAAEEPAAHGAGSAATVLATGPGPGGGAADPAARPGSASCQRRLEGFLAALGRLRGELAGGLSFGQYRERVDRARAAYEKVDVAALPLACLLSAGTPAERSYNKYVEAANAWGACLADAGCDATVVEPRLQRLWRGAAHFLADAEDEG